METGFWKRLKEVTPRMTNAERSKFLQKTCRVRQASVSRWKTGGPDGTDRPSTKHVRLICEATGAAFAYLYEGHGPKLNPPKAGSRAEKLLEVFNALDDSSQQEALAYLDFRRQNPRLR